jgi:chaperonin cofactor prefoldin
MARPRKTTIDWELIERHYRAGLLTLRQIADECGGVTEGTIRRQAKLESWTRDISAKIKQRADELVRKELLRTVITQSSPLPDEKQVVEINAQATAIVLIAQKGRISRHLKLSQAMLDELESQTVDKELYAQLGELMYAPDDKGMDKLNELYKKVLTTASRIDSHKKAVETEKTLIALEREAFNIDSKGSDSPIDAALKRIAEAAKQDG